MTNLLDPASLHARSIRRSLEDGMLEISIGLGWLVVGTISLVQIAHLASPNSRAITPFVPFFWPALAICWALAAKKIRAAYIFPRTGYVVFRKPPLNGWPATLIASAVLIAIVGLALVVTLSLPNLWNLSGPIAALVLAVGFVCGGIFFRFPHLNPLAVISLVAGTITYAAGAKSSGVLWVLLGVGAALAVSGAVRFRMFLKTHPVIQEEEL